MADAHHKQEKNQQTKKQDQTSENTAQEVFLDSNQIVNPFLPAQAKSHNPFVADTTQQPNPFLPTQAKSHNPFVADTTQQPNPFLPAQAKSINPFISKQANVQDNNSKQDNASQQSSPIQRKIKTKDGTEATKAKAGDSPQAKEMKEDKKTHLLLSNDDLKKVEENKNDLNIRYLSPHKHIIGEAHNKSKFQQAVNDWGWGAQKMLEALSKNERMPDVKGDKARANEKKKEKYKQYENALPLEDTIAKNLNSLLISHNNFKVLEAKPNYVKDLQGEKKEEIKKHILEYTKSISSMIVGDLYKYYDNSPYAIEFWAEKWAGAGDLKNILDDFDKQEPIIVAAHKQMKDKEMIEANIISQIILFVDKLIGVVKSILKQNNKSNHDIDKAVDDSKVQNSIDPIMPIRDHYMATNIKNDLQAPGLVKVGREHIKGLKEQNIPDAIFYDDYDEFEPSTYLPPF